MRRTLARLLPLILCACHHQAQRTPQGDADIQKFDATLAFLRNRNAKDYAITSRNGIDEAKYVEIGEGVTGPLLCVRRYWPGCRPSENVCPSL